MVPLRRSTAGILASLVLCVALGGPALAAQPHGFAKWRSLASKLRNPVPDVPGPMRVRDSQIEPIGWAKVDGWDKDEHAAAFATFLVRCRPIARTAHPPGETRPMYGAGD